MDQRRIVLVTADDATTAEWQGTLAAMQCVVVAVASSFEWAIAATMSAAADLILVTHGSVDASGIEAMPALRERAAVPVVMIVDAVDIGAPATGTDDVLEGVLARPYTARELQCTIELALSRSQTSRAIDATETRFFDIAIDLLCFLDFDGHFRRLSPSWEHTLGFTRDELMSKPFIEFVHVDDRARTLEQNRRVRSGEKALAFENRYMCRDGSFRWLRWNAASDSAHRTIYSVARDVTAVKQADAEREQLVQELQAALGEVRLLQGIIPICSYCRKIRDDENYWQTVETYLARHTNTRFSHSICPTCMDVEVEPQLRALERIRPPRG